MTHRFCCCEDVAAECADPIDCGLATSYNVSAAVSVSDTVSGCTETATVQFQNGLASYGGSCACVGQVAYYPFGTTNNAHRYRARAYRVTGPASGSVSGSRSGCSVGCTPVSGSGTADLLPGQCFFSPVGYQGCNLLCVNEVDTGRSWSRWYWALSVTLWSQAQTDVCTQGGARPRWEGCFSVVSPLQAQCHPPPAGGWGFGTGSSFPGGPPPYFHSFLGQGVSVREYEQDCSGSCNIEVRTGNITAAVVIS